MTYRNILFLFLTITVVEGIALTLGVVSFYRKAKRQVEKINNVLKIWTTSRVNTPVLKKEAERADVCIQHPKLRSSDAEALSKF